jgi:putative DNA primase/helicase
VSNNLDLTAITWLHDQGAGFCKVAEWDADWANSPGKQAFPEGWQNTPLTLDQVIPHIKRGGNVGMICGQHSEALCMLDVDAEFSKFLEYFPSMAKAPAIVRGGADKGKIIIRVTGENIPTAKKWKRNGSKSPYLEWLATGNQGVIPPSKHCDGPYYQLINTENPIKELDAEMLSEICAIWTGEGFEDDEPAAPSRKIKSSTKKTPAESDGLKEAVLDYWDPFEVFKHHGCVTKTRKEKKEEWLRLFGNGGLFVHIGPGGAYDGWNMVGEKGVGGGTLEAWQYCKTGSSKVPGGRAFYDLLCEMAKAGNIAIPEQPRKPIAQLTTQKAGQIEDSSAQNAPESVPDLRNTQPPSALVSQSLNREEAGDAELLQHLYADDIVYDHSTGQWFLWTGNYWRTDETGVVRTLVTNKVAATYLQAAADLQSIGGSEIQVDKLVKRAKALLNRRRIENILSLATNLPRLAITGREWDTDPWLLGVENGMLDLRTGELRPGEPSLYMRAVAPTEWHGIDAPAPKWEKFLREIFDNNEDLVTFVHHLFGYGISGVTTEHVLPILCGEGRNGKDTLLETLGTVLGNDLAIASQADAVMDIGRSAGGPQPFVYALRGKRLVWASESNEGRRINAGLVKLLTGGGRLNVRTLHSKPVEFLPSHLLMLLTNHRPHMPADDQAIWDRVVLIPFSVRFVDQPQKSNEFQRDADLKNKLKTEAPGILAWLVRGCLSWQKDGLASPEIVRTATQEYRSEEDTLGQFLEDCCTIYPDAKVRSGEVYEAYKKWCGESGIKNAMTLTAFGKRMKLRFESKVSGGKWYLGVGLSTDL